MKDSALIIGGSTGIGLATADALAGQGLAVILVARNIGRLEDAATRLRESHPGANVTIWCTDLADLEAVQRDVIRKVEQLPADVRIKHMVNSAGIFAPKPFFEHTVADFDAYQALNRTTFFITQVVAVHMKAHGGGSMVNIGSMWGKQAIKATPSSAYSMAKAGLHAFTQHLAMELSDHHIRVNAVSPAVVATPIYKAFIDEDKMESTLRSLDAMHPIGRAGEPSQVASAVVFLLDEAQSGWVTGTVMDVDGGVMAGRN